MKREREIERKLCMFKQFLFCGTIFRILADKPCLMIIFIVGVAR